MNTKSHRVLARLGAGAGGEKPPRGFSMGMYVFGAAAADYGWIALTHPHYAHRSMDYVLRTLRSLSARRRLSRLSSLRLGIVIHYLCDFCCRVHEPEHLTGLREHVDYEIALQKRLLQRQEELSRLAGELAGRLALSRTIESAVMARLEAHGRGEPSMDWDMECALWMAAQVCAAVFTLIRLQGEERRGLRFRRIAGERS